MAHWTLNHVCLYIWTLLVGCAGLRLGCQPELCNRLRIRRVRNLRKSASCKFVYEKALPCSVALQLEAWGPAWAPIDTDSFRQSLFISFHSGVGNDRLGKFLSLGSMLASRGSIKVWICGFCQCLKVCSRRAVQGLQALQCAKVV